MSKTNAITLAPDLFQYAPAISEALDGHPVVVAPVSSVYMRCCAAWEEDENTVNWGSYDEVGYLHWSRAECRP